MSDLISRSQLLKEIETWGGCVEALHEYIQNMPTAYDVDKVVEELERIRAKKTCNKEKCDTKEICRICVVDDAIEIVKQGGVSDDVCEWRKHPICGFYSEHIGAVRIINIADGYKYCPYCGKKIKVVK